MMMAQTPWAFRRRPNGSLEPEAWTPTPKAPTIESILSAMETRAPVIEDGGSSSRPAGR